VALLNLFLTTKSQINEEYLKAIIDPFFDENYHIKNDSKKKALKDEILEIKSEMEQKFELKYKKDVYSIRKVML
jgi:hypothetical protein